MKGKEARFVLPGSRRSQLCSVGQRSHALRLFSPGLVKVSINIGPNRAHIYTVIYLFPYICYSSYHRYTQKATRKFRKAPYFGAVNVGNDVLLNLGMSGVFRVERL